MGIYRKIGLTIAWMSRAFLLFAGFTYLYFGDVTTFMLLTGTFIITLIPIMLDQLYGVKFHWFFEMAISFMMALHMAGFLGAYLSIPLYDDILHIGGSSVIALIGFSILYSLNYAGRIKVHLSGLGFFTFLWTMSIGAVWEIIEFIWDNIVLLASQYGFAQNSLYDTMTDLSNDALGGVIMALLLVSIVKRLKKEQLEGMFRPFIAMIQHHHPKE